MVTAEAHRILHQKIRQGSRTDTKRCTPVGRPEKHDIYLQSTFIQKQDQIKSAEQKDNCRRQPHSCQRHGSSH